MTPRRFSEADIAAVRERADLHAIISEHVDLRRSGSSWKGLCPFHDERTPSFTINPARGTYHCFGCSAGGDAINFVQEIEGLTFPEAVRVLAERTGTTLTEPTVTPEEAEAVSTTRKALDVLAATDEFYRHALTLPAAAHAVAELRRRGFTRADAERAGCGWAPPDSTMLLAWLGERGFTGDDALTAGVLAESTTGGAPYPFFRDRLTWPIHSAVNRVVGWGARRLSDNQQGKYVNSRESPWFDKGSLLYGWVEARKAAVRTGRLLIVEGYTDVMAYRASGVDEVVAACGTAIGESHMRLIERSLPENTRLVIGLDGDAAGRDATVKTWRAASALLDRTEGVTLDGGDPCDVWQAQGPQALIDALDHALPLTQIVLSGVIAGSDTATPDGLSRTAREVRGLLAEIPDAVMREAYTTWVAQQMRLAPTMLTPDAVAAPPVSPLGSPAEDAAVREDAASPVAVISKDWALQRRIITRLCTSPRGAARWLDQIDPTSFTDPLAVEVLNAVIAAAADCDPAALSEAQWVGRIRDAASEVAAPVIATITVLEPDPASDHELLVLCPLQVRRTRALERRDQCRAETETATGTDVGRSMESYMDAVDDVRRLERKLRDLTRG